LAETKLQDLTPVISVSTNDVIFTVVDPSGTPLDRKITVENFIKFNDDRTATVSNKTLDDVVKINDNGTHFNEDGVINLANNTVLSWSNAAGTEVRTFGVTTNDIFRLSFAVTEHYDTTSGPAIRQTRDAALNDGTTIGSNSWRAQDGAGSGALVNYGRLKVIMESDVDTAEEGSFLFELLEGGTNNVDFFAINQGVNNLVEVLGTHDFAVPATQKIYLDAGGDTYIHESSANNLAFVAGAATHIDLNATGIGFFGATPVAQQSHIVDADGTLADITTKFNTLLAQVAALGLQAAS